MVPRTARNSSARTWMQSSAIHAGRQYLYAAGRVAALLAQRRELSPVQAIAAVARAICEFAGDRAAAIEFLNRIRSAQWHRRSAVVAWGDFDQRAVIAGFSGGRLELARLAVFGLAGQGVVGPGNNPAERKHRDALFQRYLAEIMREGFDLQRLARVASRVLADREVSADGVLSGMLRSVVSQRESELHAAQVHEEVEADNAAASMSGVQNNTGFFTREQVRGMLSRLAMKFDDHVSHYEELGAREALKNIKDLVRRYPVHLEASISKHYEDAQERFSARCGAWRKTIDELATRGEAAARSGDERTSKWVIRRLHAIHALRGSLLNEAHLEELVARIQAAEADVEVEEAAAALLERERAIAAEIRQLAAAVRKFHAVARRHPAEHPAYRAAADAYRAAVHEVARHDQEWLTGVFMQLEDLVTEMHDTSGRAEVQINAFIDNVRTALLDLRKEIREIHSERLDAGLGGTKPGSGP